MSTVPSKAILSQPGHDLKPGCVCQVRSGGKLYEANIVASGTKDARVTSANILPALISSKLQLCM